MPESSTLNYQSRPVTPNRPSASAALARSASARGIFCGRTGHEKSGATFESGAHRCHASHQRCLIDDPPHDERVREGNELALWEGELHILVLGETVLLLALVLLCRDSGGLESAGSESREGRD
ncbi:MAG: hypothetical protein WBZ36_17280 [Candidatus Nitrosopolaris sp.]